MSDNFKEQIEVLQDLVEAQEEYDAAYPGRHDSVEATERWNAAKAAYSEKRSFWRAIKELTSPVDEDDTATVKPESASSKTKVHNEEI